MPSPGGPFVRTCESSIYGDLGLDWRDRSVVVGPIAFVGLPGTATAPRRDFEPLEGGGFRSIKALAVVDQGAEVTVTIAPEDRAHVSLLYDPSAFKDLNAYSIADGEGAVTFRACAKGEESPVGAPDGPTQFNGGFVVDGPQCAALDVLIAGRGLPKRVNVAFGRGACASG
jgi:hypothetical protein